jgi:hypothetical protein
MLLQGRGPRAAAPVEGTQPGAVDLYVVTPITNPPAFEFDAYSGRGDPLDLAVDDDFVIEIALATDTGFAAPVDTITHTITAPNLLTLPPNAFTFAIDELSAGNHIARARIDRAGDPSSDWSNTTDVFNIPSASPTLTLGTMVHSEDAVDRATYTFTDMAIGTAADDRVVVVGFNTRAIPGITSIVIGGVTATSIASQASGSSKVWMYAAVVPTGTTATIVCTFSGTISRCGIGVISIYGASGVTPEDTAGSAIDPASATLTIPVKGVAVGFVYANNAASFTWTGLTEGYDTAVESTLIHSGAAVEYAAGGDLAVSADAAGTASDQCAVFASWGPP